MRVPVGYRGLLDDEVASVVVRCCIGMGPNAISCHAHTTKHTHAHIDSQRSHDILTCWDRQKKKRAIPLEARPSRSLSSPQLTGRAPGNVQFLFRVDTYLEPNNSRLVCSIL